jgi:hypothetical protein
VNKQKSLTDLEKVVPQLLLYIIYIFLFDVSLLYFVLAYFFTKISLISVLHYNAALIMVIEGFDVLDDIRMIERLEN